jgi:hypothetical protein
MNSSFSNAADDMKIENVCVKDAVVSVVPCNKSNLFATRIIDLAEQNGIAGCDLSVLFKVKEKPKSYMSGTMLNFSNQCFFITNPTLQYAKVQNNIFNKSEDTIMIADACLCKAFNDLTEYMVKNTSNIISTLNKHVEGYIYDDEKCYLQLSPNLAIFDKNKNPLPYSSSLWMDKDQHYEAKFLIQVYGVYVYECGGKEKMKITAKIVQMQLFELGLPFTQSDNLQTCLF